MAKQSKDRQFIIEFLQLYRQFPTLWNVKSTEYSDRNLKNEAYKVLVEKYKQVDSDADKEVVKKRINSLRTNYRKELRKVIESAKSGSGGVIYVPSLWYYNELNFLQDEEIPAKQCSTVTSQSAEEPKVAVADSYKNIVSTTLPKHRPKPAIETPPTKHKKINKKEILNLAREYLKKDDEYECLGQIWANELKKMSAEQQIHAKKAINDILYEGQLGNLHRHSVKINEPSSTRDFRRPATSADRTNWPVLSTLSPSSTHLPSSQATIAYDAVSAVYE